MDSEGTFRLLVLDPKRQQLTSGLVYELKKVVVQAPAPSPHLRWGFVFLTDNDERVFSIYLSETGKAGVINGTPVKFSSDELFSWAEETLGKVLY